MTPNHVSFADGLFVIAAIDRPIRFVVYAEYFRRPLIGRFLRWMGAIPIASTGGPKMILEAFREAGRALDDGELVCIFPEGQITRTGHDPAVPAGAGADRQGPDGADHPGPPRPGHGQHLQPDAASQAARADPAAGDGLVRCAAARRDRRRARSAGRSASSTRRPGTIARRIAGRCITSSSARRGVIPFRLAIVDGQTPELSYIATLAGVVALARALRPRWQGQESVGILLPTSVAGAVVNLAAALSGRVVVNLNFTAGRAAITSAAAQAGLRTVVTSRAFLEKAKLELPEGLEVIWLEDDRPDDPHGRPAPGARRSPASRRSACSRSWRVPTGGSSVDDPVAVIFSSGSEGEPKGVVLSHFNIDSNIEAIAQVFHI